MSEPSHRACGACRKRAPTPRRAAGRCAAARSSRRSCWCCSPLGAGRTVLSRMANAKVLDDERRRAGGAVREDHLRQGVGGAARRWRCPARCRAALQAPIAARASGYLKRWTKDIGSRVEKGELLAEIESPEIDQQLSQAIAARQQTAASLALAKSTIERWEALRKKDVVSQQELDERRSAAAQATANLAAADANVERLRQMEGFKRVVAPFSGVITRRNVDVGDLIDSAAARPLFVLTQTDPLRVYVNVPQSYAQLVKPGQKVVVTQAELRGQTFDGEVARTAGSIDTATRTMQVEITLANRDGALLPGAYVQVALPLAASAGARSCRPTRCCSAAKACASPWSMPRARCSCGR